MRRYLAALPLKMFYIAGTICSLYIVVVHGLARHDWESVLPVVGAIILAILLLHGIKALMTEKRATESSRLT